MSKSGRLDGRSVGVIFGDVMLGGLLAMLVFIFLIGLVAYFGFLEEKHGTADGRQGASQAIVAGQ